MRLLLATLSMLLFSTLSVGVESPDALVKRTAEDVLASVKADKDIQSGDKQKLFELTEEKIVPNFNFEKVSRLVLGKNWNAATPEQKTAFQSEFKTLLIRTYSTALSKYKDQTIQYKPLRMAEGDSIATVKTVILQPAGQPIAVDYTLERTDDAWKVFDIVIEGVSLVTNYRSQFAQEIRQNGMDSLIKKLVDKNKANSTKAG
ncbi:MAG TPA: toluene tolerance protein [Methylophilaceae bacterium]|nr:toluene tolerance protein [Methylophilaceae bacterium]HAJ70974.1 toluene tolerance protein [Methylophilaceae bacterium]